MEEQTQEIEIPRPRLIEYYANGKFMRSILGGLEDEERRIYRHYPLAGGVGFLDDLSYKVLRDATDGEIALALRNSFYKYGAED